MEARVAELNPAEVEIDRIRADIMRSEFEQSLQLESARPPSLVARNETPKVTLGRMFAIFLVRFESALKLIHRCPEKDPLATANCRHSLKEILHPLCA